MTNQQKLQALYDLTGPGLFMKIIEEIGPGHVFFPKDISRARREIRDISIRADFYSEEFFGMPNGIVYHILAERYGLSTDRIRKIIAGGSR
ncbi:MAG: Mor transcription activator family protein [Lawsonibacter sp.]|jgi:Mor family transcriptional regulator